MEQLQAQFGGISERSVSSSLDESAMSSEPVVPIDNNEQETDGYGIKFKDWGFKLDRLFEVACRFYKRNESKAFHPSFDIRNQMNALMLQARYGNFDESRAADVGILDLVGKNRRHQWSLLKGVSKTEAMSKFICTLDDICPFFKAYAEAVRISSGLQQRAGVLGSNGTTNFENKDATAQSQADSEEQLKAIHTSLCRQTYDQFKNYAEKQHPDDESMQKYLISSLQEQYYQQYISQLNPKLNGQPNSSSTGSSINGDSVLNQPTKVSEASTPDLDNSTKSDRPPSVTSALSGSLVSAAPEANGEQKSGISSPTANMIPDAKTNGSHDATDSRPLEPTSRPTVYQNIGPENIAKFESFPEPKPLPSAPPRRSTSGSFAINIPPQSDERPSSPKQSGISSYQQSVAPAQPVSVQSPAPAQSIPAKTAPPPTPAQLKVNVAASDSKLATKVDSWTLDDDEDNEEEEEEDGASSADSPLHQPSISFEPLEPAEFWTRKGLDEFRESLVGDVNGGTYTLYPSSLLHVEVPTFPSGKYIYWEFCTDDYDIGFGLDFVYDQHASESIRIYEQTTDDEEDDDEEEEEELQQDEEDEDPARPADGVEMAPVGANQTRRRLRELRHLMQSERLANTVSIIPTYRRDSHQELFVGRHRYPGKGYYLLKFDNTYSLFYSKKIHYRICYFI